jgi:hypothetical protein
MKDDHEDLKDKSGEYFEIKRAEQSAPAGFVKTDNGKVQMSLLPWAALKAVAQVIQHATGSKYPRDNWKLAKPEDLHRFEDAMLRHYEAWHRGEALDPQSGLHHLAHLTCNALFLVWHHCCRTDSSVKPKAPNSEPASKDKKAQTPNQYGSNSFGPTSAFELEKLINDPCYRDAKVGDR